MKKQISVLFFLCLISCKNDITKSNNSIQQVNWLLGKWENNSKDGNFKEIWQQQNDSLFVADSYIIIAKDTVFHETVELLQKSDSLFYNVLVKDQNNNQQVSFYCTKFAKNELIFENPKHDFPSKIVYKLINKNHILATVSGTNKGKAVTENFPMKRK